MGWCSGSYLADDVWKIVKKHIPKSEQQKVAKKIVELFNEHDADCWGPDIEIDRIANPQYYEDIEE